MVKRTLYWLRKNHNLWSVRFAVFGSVVLAILFFYFMVMQKRTLLGQAETLVGRVQNHDADALFRSIDPANYATGVPRKEVVKLVCERFISPLLSENCRLRIVKAELLAQGESALLTIEITKKGKYGVTALTVHLGDDCAVTDYLDWKLVAGAIFGVERELPKQMPPEIKTIAWLLSLEPEASRIAGAETIIGGKTVNREAYLRTQLQRWYDANPAATR